VIFTTYVRLVVWIPRARLLERCASGHPLSVFKKKLCTRNLIPNNRSFKTAAKVREDHAGVRLLLRLPRVQDMMQGRNKILRARLTSLLQDTTALIISGYVTGNFDPIGYHGHQL